MSAPHAITAALRPLPIAIALALVIAVAPKPGATLPEGVIADDRHADRLVGVVRGPIVKSATGRGATLDVGASEVWLWTDAAIAPGQRIVVRGVVRSARGSRGPAMPPMRRGFELTATELEHVGDDLGLRDLAWLHADATQARWARAIDDAGGTPIGRAALRGIVAGDRSAVPPVVDQRWRAVGIYHVLSVSGLHLAVVAGLVFALLRRLIAASPWGGRLRPARWAAPPALVIAIAYTLITGAQLATLRALLVITLVLVATMLDRPIRLIDALGAAAILVLAWRPEDLYDPSFQLSFTAALTLALRPPSERRGVRGWLVRGLATSTWVAITTAPITAFHFQEVSIGGIVGNLVLTPAVELIALPLALAGLALGSIGAPLIRIATWIVSVVDDAAIVLAQIVPVGRIAVASAIVLVLLLALAVWLSARVRRTRIDLLAWAALCVAWSIARTPPLVGAVRVTFLDVGQGDAALVELPDGQVWLLDAGGQANGRAITRTLAAYGHDRIDLVVISHPHPDHYLGLLGVQVPVDELWIAAEVEPTTASGPASFEGVAATLRARGTRVVHPPLGVAREHGEVALIVWGPRYQPAEGAAVVSASDPVRSINDNSLVVTLEVRGTRLLFAGDLEREGEELAVEAGIPRVDVVKVPHHGSPTSSSPSFVAATRPRFAVISCGRGNSFGFPAAEVVARWRAAGAEVIRTDIDGAITMVIDAAGRLTVRRFVVQ